MKWIKKVSATPLEAIAKVIDTLTAQDNDRTNAPSINAVNEALTEVWERIYPIGSVYINTDSLDPSTIFGGTWVKIEDAFLLGSGLKTLGTSGGSEVVRYTPAGTVGSHALTISEMPSHTHGYGVFGNSYTQTKQGTGSNFDYVIPQSPVGAETLENGGSQGHSHTFTGTAHDINKMPPYLVVNIWQRTA